jgi:DNA-binding NarL/FixJ family response regulator
MLRNGMRVLIIDDQPQVRSALRLLLRERLGVTAVGEAGDLAQALELIGVEQPDLVLLDWELPARGGAAEVLANLRTAHPGLAVIALSTRPGVRQAALAAGADGFVSKGEPPERVVDGVRGCRCTRRRSE